MNVISCSDRPVLQSCTLEDFNFQVDPYIGCEHCCHYCHVLKHAETDWRREVLTHGNLADRLASALSGIPPQTVYMGWHTDPYQPCEAEQRQTRTVLKVLQANGFSASILTKSDLVLRDVDILQAMDDAAVSVSVAFTDETIRQRFEANTRPTAARVSALRELHAAGIRTAALICPVIPHVTDVERLIDWLAGCADRIWIYGLSILDRSDRNWRQVERILASHFSHVKASVEAAVFSKTHPYWETLRQALVRLQKSGDLRLSIHV